MDASSEKQYLTYKILRFIAYIFFSIACLGMWFVAEDVIIAMSGTTEYILSKDILIITIINFYFMGILHPNTIYRQTSGLFKVAKYSMLVCCVLNLVLSIVFGKIYGLFGIILASVISRLLTNIWYEPYVLYKRFFYKNPSEYYLSEVYKLVLLMCIIGISTPIINIITISHLYLRITLKGMICIAIPSIIYFLIFRKSDEFQFLLDKIKYIIKKLSWRVKKNVE